MLHDQTGIVLVTGGSGFIGSHLNKYLQDNYYTVALNSENFDVTKKQDFQRYERENVRHVVHLAGKTFVPQSWEKPQVFFETNITGTLNAVEFCRRKRIGMTYISAYIYGQPERNPISETAAVNPNNPYAQSKYLAEELCKFFCTSFKMDITVLRLFNVFGPGQKDHFLIPSIIKQLFDEGNEICVQDLEPKRDYIYIDDVCKAIELSVEKTDGYQLYNVGSGVSFSVGEVIDMAQEIAGTAKEVISKNYIRRNELNNVIADIGMIKHAWGWKPEVSLRDGLVKCMEDKV